MKENIFQHIERDFFKTSGNSLCVNKMGIRMAFLVENSAKTVS